MYEAESSEHFWEVSSAEASPIRAQTSREPVPPEHVPVSPETPRATCLTVFMHGFYFRSHRHLEKLPELGSGQAGTEEAAQARRPLERS